MKLKGNKGRVDVSEELTMSMTWEASNAEPSLDDILDDPIVRLLMQGDRTGESEVRQLIERVRKSLATTDGDGATASAPRRKAKRIKKTRAA